MSRGSEGKNMGVRGRKRRHREDEVVGLGAWEAVRRRRRWRKEWSKGRWGQGQRGVV